MAGQLTFWFEYASTYSYPASARIDALSQAHDVKIVWKPFSLGPIFAQLGWTTSPFNLQPAKGRYMWRDMERICEELGLPFQKPDTFPQNGLLAARTTLVIPEEKRGAFVQSIYRAQFGEGQPIGDPGTVATILQNLDLDVQTYTSLAAEQAAKDAFRANTEAAQAAGIFGSPSFTCDDGELFWGNDRLEEAIAWAAKLARKGQ